MHFSISILTKGHSGPYDFRLFTTTTTTITTKNGWDFILVKILRWDDYHTNEDIKKFISDNVITSPNAEGGKSQEGGGDDIFRFLS